MSNYPLPDVQVDNRCETCPVKHRAVCNALGDRSSHALSEIMTHKRYRRGQSLWSETDEAQFVAIVVKGMVKLHKATADGRQQTLALLFPSDFIGQPFSAEHHTSAEAATEVELCCFPRNNFERVLKQHPELERELLKKSTEDLEKARDWMVALGRMSAIEKVARFIFEMARKSELTECVDSHQTSNLPTFELPLSREEIADCLGLTIETVSRNITTLKINGLIKYISVHTIEIRDPNALAKLADTEK